MKKVKYLSRHKLTEEVIKAVENYFNDSVVFDTENLLFSVSGVMAYEQFVEASKGYDAVIFVSPAQLTAELIRHIYIDDILPTLGMFIVSVPKMADDGVTREFVFDHLEVVHI